MGSGGGRRATAGSRENLEDAKSKDGFWGGRAGSLTHPAMHPDPYLAFALWMEWTSTSYDIR